MFKILKHNNNLLSKFRNNPFKKTNLLFNNSSNTNSHNNSSNKFYNKTIIDKTLKYNINNINNNSNTNKIIKILNITVFKTTIVQRLKPGTPTIQYIQKQNN